MFRGVTKQKLVLMMSGIVGMGVFLSFLLEVDYGTDPSSFMNNAIANRYGILLGTAMVIVNLILFIPEFIWGKHLINWGTIANMTLIGYICDFCRFLERKYIPSFIFTENPWRPLVFAVALFFFLIFVALYMNAGLGQAPYDSISTMLSEHLPIPYFVLRMAWDFLIIFIGVLMGGRLTFATPILALTLGPACSWVGKLLKRGEKSTSSAIEPTID